MNAAKEGISNGRYIIMGVSGSGKSTIGRALSEYLQLNFIDGDTLHPAKNIAKMARGEPLDDADREPWLDRIGDMLKPGMIIACSALKRIYRDRITLHAAGPVMFLYLRGKHETLAKRMHLREGHFMPPALLTSQLNTLEEPGEDELTLTADIESPSDKIVEELVIKIKEYQTGLDMRSDNDVTPAF